MSGVSPALPALRQLQDCSLSLQASEKVGGMPLWKLLLWKLLGLGYAVMLYRRASVKGYM